ncbi:MAG: arginase family protein, partial [Proteocatella sp.]
MFKQSYKPTDENIWSGRADSKENFDAFRWHQWIKCIDLSDEKLTKFNGKLGFCFLGFCCDKGVENNKGRIGASKAPYNIRKAMVNLPCWFKPEVELFDAGDILCEAYTLEQCQEFLAIAVEKILTLNLFPIILGGGHEVAFGHYRGLSNHLSKLDSNTNIGIINFDA